MVEIKKILAISGSTRLHSSNHQLIEAISGLFDNEIELILYEGLASLPAFNPDETDAAPQAVAAFRQAIRSAHGVLICTPEYAHGVPGALKNAIDWTVSTNEFSHKPTALITASTDGRYGHQALLETLRVLEAENIEELQLLIPFVRSKIGDGGAIKDEATLDAIKGLINGFLVTIEKGIPA
jgi:NAD(P)H-dependent FMN reductase